MHSLCESGPHCVVLAILEHAMLTRLSWNSKRLFFLCIPSIGIKCCILVPIFEQHICFNLPVKTKRTTCLQIVPWHHSERIAQSLDMSVFFRRASSGMAGSRQFSFRGGIVNIPKDKQRDSSMCMIFCSLIPMWELVLLLPLPVTCQQAFLHLWAVSLFH